MSCKYDVSCSRIPHSLPCLNMGQADLPIGTIVCFNGFLWSPPPACLPFCLRPPTFHQADLPPGLPSTGPQTKRKVSLCLVAPLQAPEEYSTNSSFCKRTTLRNHCAVRSVSGRAKTISTSFPGQADKRHYKCQHGCEWASNFLPSFGEGSQRRG